MKIYFFCFAWFIFGWTNSVLSYSFAESHESVPTGDDPGYLSPGIYLVIGVFADHNNAGNFSQYAQSRGVPAQFAYHPPRGYYYVYTFAADSVEPVVDQCMQLRSATEFADAWVFSTYKTELILADEDNVSLDPEAPSGFDAEEKAPAIARGPGYAVYFETLGKRDKPVTAVVKVVDGVRAQEITTCQANRPEVLEHARLLSDRVQLIPHAIGYRRTTFDLSLTEPVNDSTASYVSVDEDSVIRVTMPLEKLKKGDIQVMYNTYFYGNASVMREQSRYELEEMQRYLEDNPGVRVKLHGHTNGDSRGVTYLYVKEHGNFFNLRRSDDYLRRNIGANKLSKMRAETIREYLVKQGIDESRIETQGWGGAKMLHDERSPLAKQNIRVEMEVLSE
jgi:outer membrane protein OmpA-like peptidoglycan-associated protein